MKTKKGKSRWSLAAILGLSLGSSPWTVAAVVDCQTALMDSLEAFRAHTESHIRRVQILGIEVLRAFPERFPGVEPQLLAEFLALHDQSKVNQTGPFLEQFGLQDRPRPIIQDLFERMNHWQEDPVASRRLVDELNAVDRKIAQNFLARHHLLQSDGSADAVGKHYLRIEKIADVVDTVLSIARGEEFGHTDKIGLDRMTAQGDFADVWAIVVHLEKYYRQRTDDPTDHLFIRRAYPAEPH